MFPTINVFWVFDVYVFWLTIVICFFLFFWMLKKLSVRFTYNYSFFMNAILWYFLSTFFFSRLFYVIWEWKDMKHIGNIFDFFIMSDYNFSLFWAIFWFLLILIFNVKLFKQEINAYLDGTVLSFLFISIFGYIWALFWGQVYWRPTNFWIEIPYTSSLTSTLSWDLFPLPIIYFILIFLLFSVLYILSMYVKIRWLLWYTWLWIFSSIVIVLEFFNWKTDILKLSYWISLTQVLALIVVLFSFYWIFQIFLKWKNKKNIIIK